MRLVARTDVELTPEALFEALADVSYFERAARRQGAEVTRKDGGVHLAQGAVWAVRFPYRGRMREAISTLTSIERPRRLGFHTTTAAFEIATELLIAPMSRGTTRMALTMDIKPRTFGGRVILQTMRIGKARLQTLLGKKLVALGDSLKKRTKTQHHVG